MKKISNRGDYRIALPVAPTATDLG
jgi:hypothetical protein